MQAKLNTSTFSLGHGVKIGEEQVLCEVMESGKKGQTQPKKETEIENGKFATNTE